MKIKKILAGLTAVLMTATLCGTMFASAEESTEVAESVETVSETSVEETTEDEDYILGDANDDGVVDSEDVDLIVCYYGFSVGNHQLPKINEKAADYDKDGNIHAKDAVLIMLDFCPYRGDVNGDKVVDSRDAVEILKSYAKGLAEGSCLSSYNKNHVTNEYGEAVMDDDGNLIYTIDSTLYEYKYDYCEDGVIDSYDATRILRDYAESLVK